MGLYWNLGAVYSGHSSFGNKRLFVRYNVQVFGRPENKSLDPNVRSMGSHGGLSGHLFGRCRCNVSYYMDPLTDICLFGFEVPEKKRNIDIHYGLISFRTLVLKGQSGRTSRISSYADDIISASARPTENLRGRGPRPFTTFQFSKAVMANCSHP